MLNLAEISVIIPVYNVEKYLRECIDSVCNQTFKDIEIICVDDGSDDSSLEILKEYEVKDKRFKIFENSHEGPSSARNIGLDNAEGKYIYFMDSDDFIEHDALEKLYNTAEKNDTDMVIFKLINLDDDTMERYPSTYYDMDYFIGIENRVFKYDDVLEYIYKIPVSLPGKFYKSELLSDIRFEMGIIFEDNPFFVESLFKSERIYFLNEYLYIRRVRPKSITTSNKNFADFITVSDMLIDISKRYGVYDKTKKYLFRKILNNMFLRFLQVEEENREYYFARMKENLLSKKDEYDNDKDFQQINERLREIYYKCLKSNTAKEFELYLELYDLQVKLDDTIELKNEINYQRHKLIHRSQELSSKLNKIANENRKLKEKLNR